MLFRGKREATLRRRLVKRGLVAGIIGLPANLFYGTGIPACIVVIDKEHAHARSGIFMVDASRGFIKDGAKNRLRAQDLHRIVDVFTNRSEVAHYSRMVPLSEIASPTNDYNLNIPRYVDSSEPEDLHDLDAHLNGGIPVRDVDALDSYWRVFPGLRRALFKENVRDGNLDLRVPASRIKKTILHHPEFRAFAKRVTTAFEGWSTAHDRALRGIDAGDSPRELIDTLSEDLLARFGNLPLLDPYDIYQRLMDYWEEVMQDDVYLIVSNGWVEASRPRLLITTGKAQKETPDLTLKRRKYKADLAPPPLLVERYFATERAAIEALQAEKETITRKREDIVDEHSGEEGFLTAALSDGGKLTQASIKARLKAIRASDDSDDESEVLQRCLALMARASKTAKALKAAQATLDENVMTRYASLTPQEIKPLVVGDKWLASLERAIAGEVERRSRRLTTRVTELGHRYARPLPELERNVQVLGTKMERHLKTMGHSRRRAKRIIGEARSENHEAAVHRLSAAHQMVNRSWQDAPDIQRDYFPEYEAVQAWAWISSAYQLLEQALKMLIAVNRGVPTSDLRHELGLEGGEAHHLDRLFRELGSGDRRVILDAYGAYSALYGLPISNAIDFLALIGPGYTKWRYLLMEGGAGVPANHMGASLEITWAAISRLKYHVFGRPVAFPAIDRRLRSELEAAMAEVCNKLDTREGICACWNNLRDLLNTPEYRLGISKRLENTANPRLGCLPSPNPYVGAQMSQLPPALENLVDILKRSRDRKNFLPFLRGSSFSRHDIASSLGPRIEASTG